MPGENAEVLPAPDRCDPLTSPTNSRTRLDGDRHNARTQRDGSVVWSSYNVLSLATTENGQ